MSFIKDPENAIVYINGQKVIPEDIEAHVNRDIRQAKPSPIAKAGTAVVTSQEYRLIIHIDDVLDTLPRMRMPTVEIEDSGEIVTLENAFVSGYVKDGNEGTIDIVANKVERREGEPESLDFGSIEYKLQD